MNDSGDFQDVESNYCGRLSHVSSQPAIIPSSRAMLSGDKRLLIHGIHLDHRKTFFVVNFLRLIHSQIILKEFNLTMCKENVEQSL